MKKNHIDVQLVKYDNSPSVTLLNQTFKKRT